MIAGLRGPRTATPIDLTVGPATRSWVLRLAALLAGAASVALLGRESLGFVIGGLAVLALLLAPRSFGPAALVLGAATLVLRGPSPEPAALAGAVLSLHLALELARLSEALPLGGLVPLTVLRRRLPGFAVAQGVGQVAAALAWALQATGAALPWLTVGALVSVTALTWWVLRDGR